MSLSSTTRILRGAGRRDAMGNSAGARFFQLSPMHVAASTIRASLTSLFTRLTSSMRAIVPFRIQQTWVAIEAAHVREVLGERGRMMVPLSFFSLHRQSLRFRLSALISALVGTIALLVLLFFPWRMEAFSRKWVERRATGVVRVLSTAVGAGLDFDDAGYVTEMLNGMSNSPEVLYALVFRSNGTPLAGYKAELAPVGIVAGATELTLTYASDQLRVDAPLRGKGGATGTLRIGFGLRELEPEVAAHRAGVAFASAIVFLI